MQLKEKTFELTTEGGETVWCVLGNAPIESMKDRFGTDIAVSGMAVFRPSGRLLRIDVEHVDDVRAGDSFFSKLPVPTKSIREQIAAAERCGNWIPDLVGTWPGDESEAELLSAFKEWNG